MLYDLIIILAIIELCIDVGYYVRSFASLYIGKWFQKRVNITDTVVYYGILRSEAKDAWKLACPGKDLPISMQCQKLWDEHICLRVYSHILDTSKDSAETARLLAVAENESDYWLQAFPSINYGNLMDDHSYRLAVGICTPRDADTLFTHMNNSRFIRVTDAAKYNFGARVGLVDKCSYFKAYTVIGAHTVRYRRPIGTFNLYKIETKLLYWNKDTMYFEHKFVTLKDGFVRAIVLSRTHVLGMDTVSLFADLPGADTLTEMPAELRHWEDTLPTSSGKIRKKEHS